MIHQNIKCNNLTKTFVDGSLLLSSILRFDFFVPLLDWWMWTECKSGQDVAPLMSVGTDGVREWGRGPQTSTDLVAILEVTKYQSPWGWNLQPVYCVSTSTHIHKQLSVSKSRETIKASHCQSNLNNNVAMSVNEAFFLCTLEESLNWLAQISSNTLIYSFIPTSIPVQIKIHPQAPLAISSNGMDGDYGVW